VGCSGLFGGLGLGGGGLEELARVPNLFDTSLIGPRVMVYEYFILTIL